MAIATTTAIIAGAAIAGGGALAASKVSSDAAKKASKTQAKAAEQAAEVEQDAIDKAIAFQREQFEQQREDIAPFREIGLEALETLAPMVRPGGELVRDFTMQDFETDPGYQFRLSEGQKALERSAAARGGVLSGRNLKAIERYGQGVASDEFGRAFNRYQIEQANKFNRLGAVGGIGERATTQLNTLGSQYGRDVGQNLVNMGTARASGYTDSANALAAGRVGAGNAWAQGLGNTGTAINQGLTNYLLYQNLATR